MFLIIKAQKLWLKDELNDIVVRIANLSRGINIQTVPEQDGHVKVEGDNGGDYGAENFESNSIDHEGINKEYAQHNDDNGKTVSLR